MMIGIGIWLGNSARAVRYAANVLMFSGNNPLQFSDGSYLEFSTNQAVSPLALLFSDGTPAQFSDGGILEFSA